MLTELAGTDCTLRAMHARDIPAAMRLVAMAGRNQTEADWRMMLRLGEGYGFSDPHGELVASSIVLPYPPAIGWIGMVLVDERVRRQGLATRLLGNAVEVIRARGLVPMLDATPAGREVYRRLGFAEVAAITRWRGQGRGGPKTGHADVVAGGAALAEAGARADADAFGASRGTLLADFESRPDAMTLARPQGGAWLWSRAGRTATQIGPVIAAEAEEAVALSAAAFGLLDGPVLIDVLDRETALARFLSDRGFTPERSLTRMALGASSPPTPAPGLRAIAGPELG